MNCARVPLVIFGCLALFVLVQVPVASAVDDANATASMVDLCTAMRGMPGCTLKKLCDANPNALPDPYCQPISLVGSVCLTDMPRMSGCKSYVATCTGNNTCQTLYPAPSQLPTTATVAQEITSICTEMTMNGCSECGTLSPRSRYYDDCDMMDVYSRLCKAMPGMTQCKAWSAFCSGAPGSTSSLCIDDGTGDPAPGMIMYFHTGIVEYILFKKWVPRNVLQYVLSMLALFCLAVFYECLQAMHVVLDMYLGRRIPSKNSNGVYDAPDPDSPADSQAPLTPSQPSRSRFGTFPASAAPASAEVYAKQPSWTTGWGPTLIRGSLRMVMATLSYALMLVTMTYNVGLFFSVVVGLGVGSMLAAPITKSAEKAMVASGAIVGTVHNWETCC
ncbi:hypothetical protein SmJEL517_g00651 [Synchytrium microbalum]|uniref:Copper transport protein n=1 Tax=Synchytrium microbalum TaxID=1806994 RepID=A0A507CHR2_9FUNG|nr:uncharacterized protein SmJEL517_g00651 [Synchytrium microbalum]TPX37594.1 hypothetical protein SmJEL517_g00651 [Synchytrium microbalum]